MNPPAHEDDDPEHSRLYAILNIPRNYDPNTLQSQSRLLLRAFHPDKRSNSEQQDGQPTFLQIKLALDTLSDPIMKEAYDFGGMEAVQYIKNHSNLYELLSKRLHAVDRLAILEHHVEPLSSQPPSNNDIQVTANAPVYWERRMKRTENNSLFVTWKQNIGNRIRASFMSNGLINLDFSSLFSVTFGKRLLFHASRVMSGESLVKITAGRGVASIRSMRTLRSTYTGTWGVDLGPQGTIRSLLASIQTKVWKIRVALAEYFFKFSVNQFGFHGSFAWGLNGVRYKLVRSVQIQDSLELKYGLKMGPDGSLLPVVYLSTPQFSLRIPVHGLTQGHWLLTMLVADGMEFLREEVAVPSIFLHKARQCNKHTEWYPRLEPIVRAVALRKSTRLRILRAEFGSDGVDYSHWLQFWVNIDGKLSLHPGDPRRAWIPNSPGTVRYKTNGEVFETKLTLHENESLILPSSRSLLLGKDDFIC